MEDNRWVKLCWKEKEKERQRDQYGIERERYYNKNGWGVGALEVIGNNEDRDILKELEIRDRDI